MRVGRLRLALPIVLLIPSCNDESTDPQRAGLQTSSIVFSPSLDRGPGR